MLELMHRARRRGGFRRYFTNASWLVGERILRLIATLLVLAYIARYLGPDRFGELSFAQSYVGLFSALAVLGLDGVVVRELVNRPEQRDRLLGTAFTLKVIASVVTIAILTGIAYAAGIPVAERWLIGIIAAGLLFQSMLVVDLHFQSIVKARFIVQAQLVQLLLSSGIKILLVVFEADLIWFAAAVAADSFILGIGLLVNYLRWTRRADRQARWRFHRPTAVALVRDSFPLLLAGAAITAYMQIDQVMIRFMLSPEAVGSYAVAARLSEALYFLPVLINQTLFPAILDARKRSITEYHEQLQDLFDFMVLCAVAAAIVISLGAPWIVAGLFGEAYADAVSVLVIHVWSAVFVFLNNAAWRWYIAENKQSMANRRLYVALLVNVVLNYYLIPVMGIAGAAWATLVSRGLAGYAGHLFSRDTRFLFSMMNHSLTFGLLRK